VPERARGWLLGVLVSALLGVASAHARQVPTSGELRLLVVLASFADQPLADPRDHFAGTPASLIDRFVAYYAEVSSGRLRIVPHVGTPLVTLPGPRARYVQHPGVLAADALRAFVAAPLTDDDRRALAAAHALVVFFPGPGRESYMAAGEPGDPWSNFTDVEPPLLGFDTACVVAADERPPFSGFGVLCHEFGHLLGLPELYAPGGAVQEGIGKWGLMGQGTWVGKGDEPPHLDAWSKLRLGWADPVVVDRTTIGVAVPAIRDRPTVVKIPAVAGKPGEYYLLENRTRAGFDAGLPADGMLVWHVDESVDGFRTAESDASHKLLHLVEADGRGDLDRGTRNGGNRGDATDPWSGPPRWHRRFGAVLGLVGAAWAALAVARATRGGGVARTLTSLAIAAAAIAAGVWLRQGPMCGPGTPGMAPYGGGPVRVVLRNFSPPGPVMTVDVLVAPTADGAAPP
jgi:immune inhibitor A